MQLMELQPKLLLAVSQHAAVGLKRMVRLLKQVVNEAGGEKNTGGVTFSPAKPRAVGTALSRVGYVEDFFEPRTKLGFVFSGDSGGCSKFLPARPQGAGRLRRSFLTRPTPSCQNSSFPVCRTLQGGTKLRTQLEGIFSSRLEVADGALKDRHLCHWIA